jgi:putative FmdB family regulatory protein
MPIYAYRCAQCGHAKDILQKMSDAPLTICPACNVEAFSKQVTAAGFALKGSGWYVTDFRGGNSGGESSNSIGGETSVSVPAANNDSAETSTSTAASCAPGCGCH